MDKFGVLKLLSSLFDLYKQNSNGSPSQNSTPFNVDNLLSPLKNLIGNKNNPSDKTEPVPPQIPPAKTFAPLQNKMLSVMTSHDQIVERVKNNLNKQNSQG